MLFSNFTYRAMMLPTCISSVPYALAWTLGSCLCRQHAVRMLTRFWNRSIDTDLCAQSLWKSIVTLGGNAVQWDAKKEPIRVMDPSKPFGKSKGTSDLMFMPIVFLCVCVCVCVCALATQQQQCANRRQMHITQCTTNQRSEDKKPTHVHAS